MHEDRGTYHARWWVARSMRSMGRNGDRGLMGMGGLVNVWPTAPPHPMNTLLLVGLEPLDVFIELLL